ncbi:MAG: hypothetical protein LW850_21750 [Planctomycetaceae bacterium]|nr:hypothetical protein [Planctomycetaceae bacterium]
MRDATVLDDKAQAVVEASLASQSVLDNPLDVEPLDVIEKLSLDKNVADVFLGLFVP